MDKASAIKNAQKYLAKGQIDKAIAEWESVAKTFPEGNTFNYLGDLYLKKGNKESAMDTYHKAARVYMDEGFQLKALALYKKILNVNRSDAGALIALGELSEGKSITTDAIKYYLAAADVLSKDNKKDELLKVYDKIMNLAPDNLNLKVKIAEIFAKEGFTHEAAGEYYKIGMSLMERGDLGNGRGYLLKSLEIRPSSRNTLISLSQLSEKAGDLAQAENYTQIAMERTGEDTSLLLRMAHLMIVRGRMPEAAAEIQKIIAADPENTEARMELGQLYERSGELERAWEQYAPVIDMLASSGKTQEAMELLKSYKEFDPIGNGRKLATIYKLQGRDDDAVAELKGVYELLTMEERQEEALAALRDAYEIQPYSTELREQIEALEGPGGHGAGEPAQGQADSGMHEEAGDEGSSRDEFAGEESDEESYGEDESGEGTYDKEAALEEEEAPRRAAPRGAADKSLEVMLSEADAFLKYGLYGDARGLLEKVKAQDPENIDAHLKLKALYVETNDLDAALTECIVLSNIAGRNGQAQIARMYLIEAYRLNPEDPRLEGRLTPEMIEQVTGGRAVAPEPEPAVEPAFDSFEGLAPEPETDGGGSGGYEDFSVDTLGFDLENLQPTKIKSDVDEIFDEFKKGLEKQVSREDAETHYNLGIAYKEMGLVDDSIKEFQTSQEDIKYRVQSLTMLGICYKEKGVLPLAIKAFQQALDNVEAGDDLLWSIKYDLAEAFQMNAQMPEAYGLYMEVYGWNSTYRDVAERLSALSGHAKASGGGAAPRRPQAEAAGPGGDPQQKKPKSRVSYI